MIGRLIATLLPMLLTLLPVLLWAAPAAADELRPAYLELTQRSAQGETGHWHLRWKASARARLGRDGKPELPANCRALSESAAELVGDNVVREAQIRCTGPLAGQSIGLSGLHLSATDALVRVQPLGAPLVTLRLTPDAPRALIPAPEQAPVIGNVAATYSWLGVEHILLGFDHLLFVVALVLLLDGWRRIALAVTAFTLAHSITLVGATLGYLALPQRPVEAVIALSILFLALEIVKRQPDRPRLSQRYPWAVAFAFGLLHGFGFAGALAEIGLPRGDVPLALLTFNLGVEAGQLLIVAVTLTLLAALHRWRAAAARWAGTLLAYAIGSVATYWLITRLI